MLNSLISIVSSPSLEKWDWRSPRKGIGGSETGHVRMAQELHKRGYDVTSYSPLPDDYAKPEAVDPTGLRWLDTNDEFIGAHCIRDYGVVINYRDPKLFDSDKPDGAKWWFISQDVDYGDDWTPERLAKVDRYVCLCSTHAAFIRSKYPELHAEGRLFVSSNGIESETIGETIRDVKRNPKRIMYASSPDRGLLFILENWFRIIERVPEAELHVFYGFQNYDVIINYNGPADWRVESKRRLVELLKQPGVTWHDRVGQVELWRNWAESNIFFYPTDFPETSCITSMEAQACGAIPVTTNYWALKQNVLDGYKFDGLPQKSSVVKSLMLEKVVDLLNYSSDWDCMRADFNVNGQEIDGISRREEMQVIAQSRFKWSNIADQWSHWLTEDLC